MAEEHPAPPTPPTPRFSISDTFLSPFALRRPNPCYLSTMRARPERISTSPAASFAVKRRRDPGFEFAWHFHPEVELTWIVRSRGRRFVGDSIEEYRDGDLVLLGPNLPHTWHSEPDKSARYFSPPREEKSSGQIHPHEAVV